MPEKQCWVGQNGYRDVEKILTDFIYFVHLLPNSDPNLLKGTTNWLDSQNSLNEYQNI